MQRAHLSSESRTVVSDLLYLREQALLPRALSADGDARAALEREYAAFASNRGVYDQVRCLDRGGDEWVRVNFRDGAARIVPRRDLQPKGARYYVERAATLGDGEVFVSPFDLNVEHGRVERPIRPVIRFVTPVIDERGERLGFVVLNYLGARLLERLRELARPFSGDAMLVESGGGYLLAEKSREWGWLLGHDHSFERDYSRAWDAIRERDDGVHREGGDVFAFSRMPLADVSRDGESVFAVARVSVSAVSSRSRDLLWRLLSLGGVAVLVVAVSLWFWARASVMRELQEQRIAESESRLRQLSNMLLAAQESERRSISRELHDEIGQQVTAIALDLRSLQRHRSAAPVADRLDRLSADVDAILRGLHAIAARVRPAVLDDLGLRDALESLVEDFEGRHGIAVDTRLDIDTGRVSKTVGENVYRIVQEALTNASRHAETDEATVVVETEADRIRLAVSDPGRGFDLGAVAAGRLGLLGMRERAELLGGHFSLQSTPGGGTRIAVTIPLVQGGDESS